MAGGKDDNETLEEYGIRAANYLEEKIIELGSQTVAGFIFVRFEKVISFFLDIFTFLI